MSEQTKHAEHEHHIVGPMVYVAILLALLVGTALTVWASFLELGPWNPIIALAIATAKAARASMASNFPALQPMPGQRAPHPPAERRKAHFPALPPGASSP